MSSQPLRVDPGEDVKRRDGAEGSGRERLSPSPPRVDSLLQGSAGGDGPEIHLDQLRQLLLGYDDERLDRLQGWLNDPSYRAEEISKSLPRAVRLRPHGDSQLGEALGPVVETALVDFCRRDPEAAARALSPVIGAALRRAVRERLAAPLRALRLAATMPGLRWRLEARRAGVDFAEIADRHTLVYRIEHVLLYHRATGMQLVEVENPDMPRLSGDDRAAALARVRAMLGLAAEEGDEAVAPGVLGVAVETGPRLMLVALVRGKAPELLQDRLTATLDAIHLERRFSLKTFAGDPAPFELCRPLLEKLLAAEYDEPRVGWAPLAAVTAMVVALTGAALLLL